MMPTSSGEWRNGKNLWSRGLYNLWGLRYTKGYISNWKNKEGKGFLMLKFSKKQAAFDLMERCEESKLKAGKNCWRHGSCNTCSWSSFPPWNACKTHNPSLFTLSPGIESHGRAGFPSSWMNVKPPSGKSSKNKSRPHLMSTNFCG